MWLIPGGQSSISSEGSLNVVSMSGLFFFLEFLWELAIAKAKAKCCIGRLGVIYLILINMTIVHKFKKKCNL
jgi:hypothetical protein